MLSSSPTNGLGSVIHGRLDIPIDMAPSITASVILPQILGLVFCTCSKRFPDTGHQVYPLSCRLLLLSLLFIPSAISEQ